MLEPLKHFLNSQKIILASSSSWRKTILEKNLGLNIKVVPSNFPENLEKSKFKNPFEYVKENSKQKALIVANKLIRDDWFIVIGADTIVEMDGIIYEKPLDKEDAFLTLQKLKNRTHRVLTGVTLLKKKQGRNLEVVINNNYNINRSNEFDIFSFYEMTEVTMGNYADDAIRAYVDTNEPLDKAGSYGHHGLGSSLVKAVYGDYFNVIGFPVYKFCVELNKFIGFYHNIQV